MTVQFIRIGLVVVVVVVVNRHRLNGSSSPELTATSRSYGNVKNSTLRRTETPEMIEVKFSAVDYVRDSSKGPQSTHS